MLVIGNGESRLKINLKSIQETKIGCNAIHRDICVDHLICVDRRMVQEALENNIHESCKIYTRSDWGYDFDTINNLLPVPDLPYQGTTRPDEPFQWGSGPYAVLLGAQLSNKVQMLGFDLYGNNTLVNNVYKDTHGYDNSVKNAVDPRYWIYQISKVFEYYPNVEFKILQDDVWDMPEAWKKSNVSLDKISNIK